MQATDPDQRREVALFRFGLIGPLLHLPEGSQQRRELVRQIVEREHEIPGSRRRRVARSTLCDWLRRYRENGFDALYPRYRVDREHSRSLPSEVVGLLTSIKEREPRLTVKAVMRQALDSGQVPQGVRLAHSTVNRLLKQAGLMQPPADQPEPRDRRRFSWPLANDMWQVDVMHGPKIAAAEPGRRKARSYLLAFLDDSTRVVPHAAFSGAESAEAFLPVFQQAIRKRGAPLRLYADNGANFRSKHVAVICAQLGISLIHARPYAPQGKGKIERFFRRLRADFLPLLGPRDLASLAALNRRLAAWIEGDYHHAPHHGLDGDTPLDRWAKLGHNVRYPGPEVDLRRIFCFRFERRVSRARTVSVNARLYETDAALAGHKVVLLLDPSAPPEQPLDVLHNNQAAGRATLLDLHANARLRRHAAPAAKPPPTAGQAPARSARGAGGEPPDDPPPAPRLALRDLPGEETP